METNVSFVTARNSLYCPCVRIEIPCSILKYVVVNYSIRVNQIFSSKHLHYLSYNKKNSFMLPEIGCFLVPRFEREIRQIPRPFNAFRPKPPFQSCQGLSLGDSLEISIQMKYRYLCHLSTKQFRILM